MLKFFLLSFSGFCGFRKDEDLDCSSRQIIMVDHVIRLLPRLAGFNVGYGKVLMAKFSFRPFSSVRYDGDRLRFFFPFVSVGTLGTE